jgi:hypothetical protein
MRAEGDRASARSTMVEGHAEAVPNPSTALHAVPLPFREELKGLTAWRSGDRA